MNQSDDSSERVDKKKKTKHKDTSKRRQRSESELPLRQFVSSNKGDAASKDPSDIAERGEAA